MSRVLFICVRNSARSQIAEALLNQMCKGEPFKAESAGLEPGTVNPLAVEVLREIGIDISKNGTRSVFDVFKAGHLYSHVITVCDDVSAESCPIFLGIVKPLHWSVPDPASIAGSWEERLQGTRQIRDQIRDLIAEFCGQLCHP